MGQCASSNGSKERKSPREHRKEATEAATRGHDVKPGEKADHGKAGHVVSEYSAAKGSERPRRFGDVSSTAVRSAECASCTCGKGAGP